MPLDEGIVNSVANANMKTLGDSSAATESSAQKSHVSHLNRMQMIAENAIQNGMALAQAITAQSVKSVTESDLGEQIAQLGTALGQGQIGTKIAQTTPPVSSPNPVIG